MNLWLEQFKYLDPGKLKRLEEMKELSEGRLVGWERLLIDRFPALTTIPIPTIIGMFSWSQPSIKNKMLLKHHAVDYGAGWCTPADVARDYLAVKYPKRRIRMTTSQYQKCVKEHVQPPLYCTPCELEDGVYVDIQSAYWSILKAVGWDVNYNPNTFLGVNSDVRDFPLDKIKLARNCLVSCGLSGQLKMWTGEKLIIKEKGNKFVNMILWRLVMDVLNGICADCIEAGAVYCYTDGFIVPRQYQHDVEAAITAWGFNSSVKHQGRCVVRGVGEYAFPDYKTATKPRSKPTPMSKYYDPGNNWLRWRIAKFAALTRDDL